MDGKPIRFSIDVSAMGRMWLFGLFLLFAQIKSKKKQLCFIK